MSVDGQKPHMFKLVRYVDGRNHCTVTCVCLRCTGLVCDSHYSLFLLITPGLMSVQLSRSCKGLKDECETGGNDLNRRKAVVLEKVLVRALLCLHSSGGKSILYLNTVGITVHSCANACSISVVRDAAVQCN